MRLKEMWERFKKFLFPSPALEDDDALVKEAKHLFTELDKLKVETDNFGKRVEEFESKFKCGELENETSAKEIKKLRSELNRLHTEADKLQVEIDNFKKHLEEFLQNKLEEFLQNLQNKFKRGL